MEEIERMEKMERIMGVRMEFSGTQTLTHYFLSVISFSSLCPPLPSVAPW